MPQPPPPVGWVRIVSADPPLRLRARLADERPNLDEGFGGWDLIERPRRPPLTTWKAPPGRQLTLPLMLDAWESGVSIEGRIATIEKMGRPTASDGEPPQLQVESSGAAVPHLGLTWVVSSISWGDALMNASGNRVRQQVTLVLVEYVEDVYLRERSAANRRRKKAQRRKRKRGARSKKIVAGRGRKKTGARTAVAGDFGAGEDLLSIAARELGDAERWVEIAELNGLRDPRAVAIGQVLRLP